jgi:hypothetical protein
MIPILKTARQRTAQTTEPQMAKTLLVRSDATGRAQTGAQRAAFRESLATPLDAGSRRQHLARPVPSWRRRDLAESRLPTR